MPVNMLLKKKALNILKGSCSGNVQKISRDWFVKSSGHVEGSLSIWISMYAAQIARDWRFKKHRGDLKGRLLGIMRHVERIALNKKNCVTVSLTTKAACLVEKHIVVLSFQRGDRSTDNLRWKSAHWPKRLHWTCWKEALTHLKDWTCPFKEAPQTRSTSILPLESEEFPLSEVH